MLTRSAGILGLTLVTILSACSDGGSGSTPPQVTPEQLAANGFMYRKYGVAYFKVPATGARGQLGIWVNRVSVDRRKNPVRKIYYEVQVDKWGQGNVARSDELPGAYMETLSDDLLAASYGAIIEKSQSRRLLELATTVSKFTICAHGTPRASDRESTRWAVSPAQSAKINSTFGGNPDQLLGKTPEELRKLGLGGVASGKGERVPVIDHKTHSDGYVDIHMMCLF